MRTDLLESRAERAPRIARPGSRKVPGPAMIGAMELPREDLLECRRRGDYQRYAWSLAGARARDDAFVKMSAIRRLQGSLDLGVVKERNRLPSLVTASRQSDGGPESRAAICELGHLRDLLEAMASLDSAPTLGDLPSSGGLLPVRIAAVAIYDQSLLDGIAVWVEDDPRFEQEPTDPIPRGQTSDWNKKATLRGCRLWELRKLITEDYDSDAASGTDQETGDPYVWAHKVGGKESVLPRVANLASWSPARRAFETSSELRPSMLTRPHDVWTREKLSEYWDVLRRRAVEMGERECSLEEISKTLRVHRETVERWLSIEEVIDS